MFKSNKTLDRWSRTREFSGTGVRTHMAAGIEMLCFCCRAFGCFALAGVIATRGSAQVPALNSATAGKPIYNSEREAGEPQPAAESIQNVQLPLGFSIRLFAHEPVVQNPIAMTFDHRAGLGSPKTTPTPNAPSDSIWS